MTRLVNHGSRGLNAMLDSSAAFDGEIRRRVAQLVALGQLTPDEAGRLCALWVNAPEIFYRPDNCTGTGII
ncbi:MAG: hypothetical protein ACYC3P_08755 [Bellilinea sp.]